MLTLNSAPTSNTLNVRVSLLNAGAIRATLNPGDASPLTVAFDQVMLVNPGHPPVVRNQQTVGNFTANPGNVAIIANGPGGAVDVSYAPPGGNAQRVRFL